jgi:cell division protein FtsI/penicillin-binding protein 2
MPASTMKLVTSLAGVAEKVFDPAVKVRVADRPERLDLTDALAISSNFYFKSLGDRVGAERIISYARQLGFGELTGINYEGEIAGRLPALKAGLDAGRLGAYGEGVEVTPIQLASLVSAIANGGTVIIPRVPRTPQEAARLEPQARRRLDMPRATLAPLVAGMVAAVERGTGSSAKDTTTKLAGKTGSVSSKKASIGMFASFAPADDPRLLVVVLTRGPEENGRAAAGIAGEIYRTLGGRR